MLILKMKKFNLNFLIEAIQQIEQIGELVAKEQIEARQNTLVFQTSLWLHLLC